MLMTLQEAIENPLGAEEFQLRNWLKQLDEYIKRDTPQKIEKTSLGGRDKCPNCGELMALRAKNFCDKCGHRVE